MISDSNYEAHKDEVELLTNILFEQLHIVEDSPQYILEIKVTPDVVEEPKLDFMVKFTLPSEYPNASPIFEINDSSNHLASSKIKSLIETIKTFVEENLGMPMVYQIYEMVKDFANEQEQILHDEQKEKTMIEEEKLKKYNDKLKQMETTLIETRTFTPVTKENFEVWFKKFYAEQNKGKEKKLEQEARQSGREYFMKLKADGLYEEEGPEEEESSNNETSNNTQDQKDNPVFFDAGAFEENIDDIDFEQEYIEDD
jgi:hypothetical protein